MNIQPRCRGYDPVKPLGVVFLTVQMLLVITVTWIVKRGFAILGIHFFFTANLKESLRVEASCLPFLW